MKQIIAAGCGAMDSNNPWLDLYILAQSNKKLPKVCLLPTASADNQGVIRHFMDSYDRYPCVPSYLELFSPSERDFEDFIMDKDIIFVSGGQSKSMLGIWKEWGIDTILRKAYDAGKVLSGGSAGAVCWFQSCITDSFPGSLSPMNCLGLLPHSFSPHFASQSRRAAYRKHLTEGGIVAGFAADDGAALHFIDGQYHRSVSSRPWAKTYSMTAEGRTMLKTDWLGIAENQNELIWKSPAFASSVEEEPEQEETLESKLLE